MWSRSFLASHKIKVGTRSVCSITSEKVARLGSRTLKSLRQIVNSILTQLIRFVLHQTQLPRINGRGSRIRTDDLWVMSPASWPDCSIPHYHLKSTPDRIRTCDRPLRRRMLYPAELRVHMPRAGLEPALPIGNKILSLACLPIPPPRRFITISKILFMFIL